MALAEPQDAEQAEEFLAWCTSKTAQTKFSQISGFPPARTDLGSAVTSNATVATFAKALPYAKLYLAGRAAGRAAGRGSTAPTCSLRPVPS